MGEWLDSTHKKIATQIEPQIGVTFLFAQEDWTKGQEKIDLFLMVCLLTDVPVANKTNTLQLIIYLYSSLAPHPSPISMAITCFDQITFDIGLTIQRYRCL